MTMCTALILFSLVPLKQHGGMHLMSGWRTIFGAVADRPVLPALVVARIETPHLTYHLQVHNRPYVKRQS